jgi:ABC-2 type transport system permease protein
MLAMNWPLWKKTIRESYLLFISCAIVLYVFCWFRVWITSRLDMGRFKNILESLPESWQRLAPVPIDQLYSYEGRIAVTFEEPVVYLMMAVWAIARSSDAVSGAVGRGTMEMLLAQPISRKSVLLTHTAVTLLGVLLLASITYAGIYTGIATTTAMVEPQAANVPLLGIQVPLRAGPPEEKPMSALVDPMVLLPATLNYLSLGVFLVGLTTMLSSWDRYRWRTIGLAVGFYVVEMVLEVVGLAVEGLQWIKSLTFLSAYEPIRFVSEALRDPAGRWAFFIVDDAGAWNGLGPLGLDAVLIGLGAIGIIAATLIFCRRDLPAPL